MQPKNKCVLIKVHGLVQRTQSHVRRGTNENNPIRIGWYNVCCSTRGHQVHMKIILLSVLFALALHGTTLTGTLRSPNSYGGASGVLTLAITQGGNITPACGGGGQVNTQAISITVTNGVLQSPPTIVGNDCIQTPNTAYNVTFVDSSNNRFTASWRITGTSFNLTSQTVSSTANPLLQSATQNQYVSQQPGSLLIISDMVALNSFGMPRGVYASRPATPFTGQIYIVTDASAAGTCGSGGSAETMCEWNGASWGALGGAAQVYPGAGIGNSTGSGWGTSYTTTGTGTAVALSASPAFTGSPTAPTQSTADNSTKLATTAYVDAGLNLLSETRPAGTPASSQAKNVAVTHGSTSTLLNISGSAGYVSSIFFASVFSDNTGMNNSTMTITVDGNTVFNDRFVLFFGAEYMSTTVNFRNRYIGGNQNGGTTLGVYSYIPIPFTNSISITWTNAASAATANIFYTVSYQTGVPNVWPRMKALHVASGTVPIGTLGVDTVATMVNATSLNQGRLLGVYMSLDGGAGGSPNPRTAGLEGRVKIYLDGAGSPQYQSSGTEDYFMQAGYFSGIYSSAGTSQGATQPFFSSFDAGYSGLQFLNLASSGSPVVTTVNAYRFHIMDPVFFANAIKVTWDAGYSTSVNYTGTYRLAYTIWYYTE